MNRFGLTIAVPRGALLRETLDLLDRIGVETAEVRANDRKLLFADAGIVTMRPSDVPTYVEAGAADVGITGKDVLTEQDERQVVELLELPQRRGAAGILDFPEADGLAALHELLEPRVAERMIFDLGLSRPLSYYTGAVFEVYDAALGAPLGGGGRYDDLVGRFGRPLPAVGFALGVDRLHAALSGEEHAGL